jgi:hypothetical protein
MIDRVLSERSASCWITIERMARIPHSLVYRVDRLVEMRIRITSNANMSLLHAGGVDLLLYVFLKMKRMTGQALGGVETELKERDFMLAGREQHKS